MDVKVSELDPVQKFTSGLERMVQYLLIFPLFLFAACAHREVKKPVSHIDSISPGRITEGSFRVTGKDFLQGSSVRLNGQALPTTYEDPKHLTAELKTSFVPEPGYYPVSAETPSGALSNSLELFVSPAYPVPLIKKFFPDQIRAGVPFNVQPNGSVAMAIFGANFQEGAWIEINGESFPTFVSESTRLTWEVPLRLFASAGEWKIQIRNPDGKKSLVSVLKISL